MRIRSFVMLASAGLVSIGISGGVLAQQADMSFFVTSAGSGKGADFGGLAGAEALPDAGRCCRRGRQDLARLPERFCSGFGCCRQRA